MKKAVVLLSGGLDSATALAWAVRRGYQIHALAVRYGQRHEKELESARRLSRHYRCPLEEVSFVFPWKGSSLTDRKKTLPRHKLARIGRGLIPSTYVPARNTVFLSFALAWADTLGAETIVLGANALDYSGYPDCRPDYMKAFERVARLGTRLGTERKKRIQILTPLIRKSKADIVKLGRSLGVPYSLTWSCYSGGKTPCGKCDSCLLRAKGFEEAGMKDPAL